MARTRSNRQEHGIWTPQANTRSGHSGLATGYEVQEPQILAPTANVGVEGDVMVDIGCTAWVTVAEELHNMPCVSTNIARRGKENLGITVYGIRTVFTINAMETSAKLSFESGVEAANSNVDFMLLGK